MYNIGDRIVDEKRDITITDVKRVKEHYKLMYKYRCNKCGFDCSTRHFKDGEFHDEYWILHSHLKRGTGCTCCRGRAVVKDINSIYKTHPHVAKYFVNEEDSYKYSYGSSKKVNVKCPECGDIYRTKANDFIRKIENRNFYCLKCSDKNSLGERMVYSLLFELGVDFVKEAGKNTLKWIEGKRYDFYIKIKEIIVEVMGEQHTNGKFERLSGKTLEEEQANDLYKYNLAMENGILPENYIYIDAYYSDFEYIKGEILKSRLAEIYDLSSIDWNIIKEKSTQSLVRKVADYWNENPEVNTLDVAHELRMSRPTATKYLKQANELGWCKYDKDEYTKRRKNIYIDDTVNTANPIKCNETNTYFKSYGLCARKSKEAFGIQLNAVTIDRVAKGKFKQHRGYTFTYITKQEFNEAIDKGYKCYGTKFRLNDEENNACDTQA